MYIDKFLAGVIVGAAVEFVLIMILGTIFHKDKKEN